MIIKYATYEEAAKEVGGGLSHKSLSDYLMTMRRAKKYNFNFQAHKNDKMGVMRSFVRRMRDEDSSIKKPLG